jgi:MFS family permease
LGAAPGGGRAFGAFQHRDFRLFWIGLVISHLGGWMQQVAQGWLVYELTGSAFLLGLNGLFRTLPFLGVSFYAGALLDRVDRKKVLVWSEAASMALVLLLGVLIAGGWVQIWHIYAISLLSGAVSAFDGPARGALLPALVPRQDLMTAFSLNSIVRKGSQIIGPAIGGIFVASFGIAGAFFIHSGAYLVLLTCLAMIRTTSSGNVEHTNVVSAMLDGLRYVRSETIIGTLLVMETVISVFGAYSQMMVIFARDIFWMGPEGLGFLQSAVGAGSLTGSLVLATVGDIRNKGRLLIVSGLVHGTAIAAFAFCPAFGLALPILFIAGASDILFGATRTTMIQLLIREDMRGRVMALSSISMRGVGPLGSFQTGTLASFVGIQSAVALGAGIILAMLVGAALRAPQLRAFGDGAREHRPLASGRAEPAPTPQLVSD